MQLFPQNTSSAKNTTSQAYSSNQAESAKGIQQLQEAGQQIAQIVAMMMG